MVIGCVIFTLPHFLNPEQVHSRDDQIADGQYAKSVLNSASASQKINSFLEKGRLKSESGGEEISGGNGIPYNSTKDNETSFHLQQRALVQDTSTPSSIPHHPSYRQGGRNSICHSANPQSSRFISATSSRLNNNHHADLNDIGNGGNETYFLY